jgi:nitroreductase
LLFVRNGLISFWSALQNKKPEGKMFRDLVLKNRSYRRFYQDSAISWDVLQGLVDLARLTASAGNKQPLKYIISSDQSTNAKIFSTLAWAGYLKDWPGPPEGERPSAYIIMLGDTGIANSFNFDNGIAAQTILLGAVEQGLGGCMIMSVQREKLRELLKIPPQFEILLAIALGKPKETVILEDLGADGDVKYWRDEEQKHHVPKRLLKDVILS